MNNKGAIFSGFMYVLLVFFLLSLAALLLVLNNTKKVSNKAREGAQNIIEDDNSEFSFDLKGLNSFCLDLGENLSTSPKYTNGDREVIAKDKEGNVLSVTISSDLDIWKAGTYTITYTAKDKNKEKSVERKVYVLKNDFSYVNSPQEFISKCEGYYQVELWGSRHAMGMGGYTKGIIKLNKDDKLYVYTGEYSTVQNVTSFNGGTGSSGGYPGGGATDVRLLNTTWSDLESLKSRIMVAGGAGAGNVQYSHGGGLIGVKSGVATGGTQTLPGTNEAAYLPPSFGIGGGGCGGGGGYYGAGGATCVTGGAGGSSFISGAAGVNAITNDTSITHTNNTLHYSGKYFVNTSFVNGNNNGFGKAKITYVGPNYPKINTKFNNVRYVKDCINGSGVNVDKHWIELQVIKNGLNLALGKEPIGTSPYLVTGGTYPFTVITDGLMDDVTKFSTINGTTYPGIQCVTIDLGKLYDIDEVAVWHYYGDGRTYTNSTTSVSPNNTAWDVIMSNLGPETANGSRVNAWN